MKLVKERLSKLSGGQVLDVGTGRGEFLSLLSENLGSYTKLIAIDSEEKMLEMAKENCEIDNLELINMDGAKMSFGDNRFDTVCISNTLHHLPKLDETIKEMKRVLKPGGYFIINEMFQDHQSDPQMSHVLLHHMGADIDELEGRTHRRTYLKKEIIDVIQRIGIEIVDTFEFRYGEEITTEKNRLDEIAESIRKKVATIKDHPQFSDFEGRGEEIIQWLYDHGISGATQLMVIGRL